MRNPWRMQDGPDNKINRNNFPMSFQYNGTFKYGKIYPIGLIRTIPGASYQIDSTLALNFLPTAFPIQTRQRAYVHFFYGRDRNFWKDYKDFVNGMNPDLVKPYLDTSVTKPQTGSLLDYLGVPTTLVGNYGSYELHTDYIQEGFGYGKIISMNDDSFETRLMPSDVRYEPLENTSLPNFSSLIGTSVSDFSDTFTLPSSEVKVNVCFGTYFPKTFNETFSDIRVRIGNQSLTGYINDSLISVFPESREQSGINMEYNCPVPREEYNGLKIFQLAVVKNGTIQSVHPVSSLGDNGHLIFNVNSDVPADGYMLLYLASFSARYTQTSGSSSGLPSWPSIIKNVTGLTKTGNEISNFVFDIIIAGLSYYGSNSVVRDIDDNTSPYWRSGSSTDLRSRIKLNAIPCRMYETIYNLYYRNPQNNPYILNGKPEYNVFIPTKDGGPDNNLYELRYRNWEDDFLTTAVQTPQQGIAPLVGLTDRGATVTLTNEDGSVTRYVTNLDENGNVTGIETTDSSEPLLTQALIDAVSYGISIEDLRNVNAMQKWLELNLRKGYQYKDIIEARWGISISYNELDLPEFIGGFTQEVGLQAVTQTTSHGEGIEGALGWQAGRMYASGSGRSITHYCEEEGYIMALLTIVPVPNYSQLLPKHWFTRDLLDSYQPEFNHIGFQPITYKEVCPIQAYQESTENVDVLEQTFGYQRPWYEYFNQVDEVHGQFRTTFKDFLINRTFDVKPELSESFLLVDPNQVNDVFAVTTDDDKILGAINHSIVAKLPISLYAQARLE